MIRFRFASWNVNYRNLAPKHLSILQDLQANVVALQEVSPRFHQSLNEANIFDWSVFSLDMLPTEVPKTRARRIGCSVFGREPFSLVGSSLLPGLAFPERALVAKLNAEGKPFTICSFHTPPGSNWDDVKPQTLEAIARWLASQQTPLMFGIDANAPKTDHPDIRRNEWWWDLEPSLLGSEPIHKLRDAYRHFLETHPDELARVIRARPQGPLAVSHIRGRGQRKTECRYDFIYVSSEIVVQQASYLFEDAVKAASDHAVVIADLQLFPNTVAH